MYGHFELFYEIPNLFPLFLLFLAFHKAGRRDQAVKVLEQLCHNAVVEHRLVLHDKKLLHLLLLCSVHDSP